MQIIQLLKSMLIEQLKGILISDFLLLLLSAVIITLVIWVVMKNRTDRNTIIRYFLLVLYGGIIILITIVRREPGSRSGEIVPYIELGAINGDIYMLRQTIYSLFNVVLFVPFGSLLASVRRYGETVKDFIVPILTGFLFSFMIEIIQLITMRGVFELTDILTNVVGAAIGVLIVKMVRKVRENEYIKEE